MKRRALIMSAVLASALILSSGTYRSVLYHFSCMGCRNFRYVSNRYVCGIRIWSSERLDLASGVPSGHVHNWWRYSLHTSTVISKTFACNPHRFQDGTDER